MNNEMRPNLGRILPFMPIGSPQTKFVPSWDKFFYLCVRNLPLNSFLGLLLECFEEYSQFDLVSIVI